MKVRQCVIRADASKTIGIGHVVRCVAIADALSEHGYEITFAGRGATRTHLEECADGKYGFLELSGDAESESAQIVKAFPAGLSLIIIDHYQRSKDFEGLLRDLSDTIVAIDGWARPHLADLVVSPGPGLRPGHSAKEDAVILGGGEFAILRSGIATVRHDRRDSPPNNPKPRVLVSFGGSAVASDYLSDTIAALIECGVDVCIDVMAGSTLNPEDAKNSDARVTCHPWLSDPGELFAKADLYVGAAGGTALEAAAVGLPSVIVAIADNQKAIARFLVEAGAAIEFNLQSLPDELMRQLNALLNDPAQLSDMAQAGRTSVSADGADRISAEIIKLAKRKSAA